MDGLIFRLKGFLALYRLSFMSSLMGNSEGGSGIGVFYKVKILVMVRQGNDNPLFRLHNFQALFSIPFISSVMGKSAGGSGIGTRKGRPIILTRGLMGIFRTSPHLSLNGKEC